MSAPSIRKQLFDEFARLGKAISSPSRLELLDLLCQGSRTVEDLAKEASLSVANASQHLQVLKRAHLIDSRRDGAYVHYQLADNAVYEFWRGLQRLARRRLAEVDQVVRDFFESRDKLEPITAQDLSEKMRSGDVIVLDVRPREEYAAAHIDGALSVPLEELERRLAELPNANEIVAYCRGPYCVLAVRALEVLTRHGFRARRMDGGLPEWRAEGLPVAEHHSYEQEHRFA